MFSTEFLQDWLKQALADPDKVNTIYNQNSSHFLPSQLRYFSFPTAVMQCPIDLFFLLLMKDIDLFPVFLVDGDTRFVGNINKHNKIWNADVTTLCLLYLEANA